MIQLSSVIQPPNPNAKPVKFDFVALLTNLGALAALAFGFVIFIIAIITVWKNRSNGDISGSASSLGVVAICTVIAAVGVGGVAIAYGAGMLRALTGLWS